jgi:ferrous-iron efflux pump FieF
MPDPGKGGSYAAKEKTILTSLIVDFILWIPDVAAAILSGSIVLLADATKCANEILATFFAYLTIRKMARGDPGIYDYGMGKFETVTSIITGAVMLISLIFVLSAAIYRLIKPEELVEAGVTLGIALMIIGVVTNTWLWRKNYRLFIQEPSPIMDSQWRLFRTKAISDFAALTSLVAGIVFSHFPWSLYIDPFVSFFIVGVLLASGYRVIVSSLPDLLDKTLDEELQMVIVQHLAVFFHDYAALHGVRSRRSGSNIYIEIFLEFDRGKSMGDVQDTINRIKAALEKNIPKSSVSIVPTDLATNTREESAGPTTGQ